MRPFASFRAKSWAGAVFLCLSTGGGTLPAMAQTDAWGQSAGTSPAIMDAAAPLPEEKAFQAEAISTDQGALVRLTPAPGYYLYQAKTRFVDQEGRKLTGSWPQAEIHDDPHFGPTPIHRGQIDVLLSEKGAQSITVSFQGCQDAGICYPPMQRTMNLSGGGSTSPAAPTPQQAAPALPPASVAPSQAEDQQWAERLAGKSWIWTLGAFFLVGLGLSMTPCVLPMVPIVLGLVAPAHQHGKNALGLASLYVLAHAAVLATIGAIGGALGGGAGLVQQLQTPFWLSMAATTFVLLAAWQAGWVGHGAGPRFTQWLHAWMGRIPQGRAWGALALGAGSALVLGPCVAPATAGALLYVANKGSVALGAGALFAMGVGMGFPMMLLAAGGQRLLPTAGAWMAHMTKAGAMGLLGVAAILLDRATGQQWQMAWLAAWAIASVSLWAKASWATQMRTAAAVASVLLIFLSNQSSRPQDETTGRLVFETVTAQQLQARLREGQPILLDLSADWCTSCLTMEKTTFADPSVAHAAKDIVSLRLNLDEIDEGEREFLKEQGLIGPPAILFFNKAGIEIRGARLIGPENSQLFLRRLQAVVATPHG